MISVEFSFQGWSMVLPKVAAGDPFERVHEAGNGQGGRIVDQKVDMVGFPVELHQGRAHIRAHHAHDTFHVRQHAGGKHAPAIFGYEDQVGVQCMNDVATS